MISFHYKSIRAKLSLLSFSFLIVSLCISGCRPEIRITVLGENSSNLQAMEALKGDFESANDLKIDFRPNTFEEAFNKSNQDFSNGTGLYDIVLQYNFSLSSFVRNNYVYRIDELLGEVEHSHFQFEQELFSNAWEEVGFYYKNPSQPDQGSAKIGYPFAANTMLLVYNKEMFEDPVSKEKFFEKSGEKLDVPTDWDTFKAIADFFTDSEKRTYGVCLQGAAGGWLYYEYCNFLYSFGGKVFEKERGWEGTLNTPIAINSEQAIEATEFYRSLKPYNAGSFITIDVNEQLAILKAGNVAMGIVWSDYLFNFIYDSYGNIDSRFGFAPIPGEVSPLAGGCFYINRDSKYQDKAFEYVLHLMQKESQIELALKGLCSPLSSTYSNQEVKKIPYSDALEKSLKRGVYMFEAGPESDLVNQTLTNYLQRMWNDEMSAEQALRNARDDIQKGREDIFSSL